MYICRWKKGCNVCIFVYTYMQGLIFVVDSNDRERIQEAREELERMVIISPSPIII